MGWEPGSRREKTLAALVVLLIVGLGVVSFAYSQSASSVGALKGSLSTATSQLSSEQSQLSTAQSSVSALDSNVTSLKAIIVSDNSTISSDNTQIASLKSELSSDGQSIAKLTAENASASAEISSLQGNATANASKIALLESQQAGLQTQVASLQAITNMNSSKVEVSSATYLEKAGEVGQFKQFPDNYAGYLLIVGGGNSTNFYIGVNLVYSNVIDGQFGETASYLYGAGGNYVLVIPITPGIISLSLGNYDTSGTDAVQMTVTYYY